MELQRLLGNLEEKVHQVSIKINTIDKKVDHLLAFKWQIIGGSVTLSFMVTLIFELLRVKGD